MLLEWVVFLHRIRKELQAQLISLSADSFLVFCFMGVSFDSHGGEVSFKPGMKGGIAIVGVI